jgi:hypothetical protein
MQEARVGLAAKLAPQDLTAADLKALRVLTASPQTVELVTVTGENDQPVRMAVHPKSVAALLELADLERYVGFLAAQRQILRDSTVPDDQKLVQRVSAELAYLYAVAAWAMTTPGPGVPWPDTTATPDPPPLMRSLGPLDFLRLFSGFHEANRLNEDMLSVLCLPPGEKTPEGASRPHLAGFLSLYAQDTGIPVGRLVRDMDLPGLLTAARLAAGVREEQHRQAKAAAERERAEGSDDGPQLRRA